MPSSLHTQPNAAEDAQEKKGCTRTEHRQMLLSLSLLPKQDSMAMIHTAFTLDWALAKYAGRFV